MPMPTNAPKTATAPKTGKEEIFSPFSEDQQQEQESREVVVSDSENTIVVPSTPITYDYTPTAEDVSMPRIMLLQGNAEIVLQGNARAGQWMLPGNIFVDEFTVDVLGMRRSRIRSTKPPQNSQDKPKPLCISPNAIQGYGDPGVLCAECPFARWGEKDPKTGKGTPPECRLRYHYLVETDEGERAEMMIGTTTRDSKNAAQAITEGIARWGSGGTFRVTVTKKLAEGGGGNKFFVPVVRGVEKIATTEVSDAPGFDEE
jgi:hypothetical protein